MCQRSWRSRWREPQDILCWYLVIAQFINMFNYTNLGMIIAVKSAGALQAAGFTGIPLMIFFILLCCVVNLFMTSGTAKWYIFAPILVPMMMMLDIARNLPRLYTESEIPQRMRSLRSIHIFRLRSQWLRNMIKTLEWDL